jgi:1,4-dihydroxy-2-naphthoate octaprenyltransferase
LVYNDMQKSKGTDRDAKEEKNHITVHNLQPSSELKLIITMYKIGSAIFKLH